MYLLLESRLKTKSSKKFTTETPYKTWKNEVQMWQIITSVEKKQKETAFTKTAAEEKWYQNIRTNLSNTYKARIESNFLQMVDQLKLSCLIFTKRSRLKGAKAERCRFVSVCVTFE